MKSCPLCNKKSALGGRHAFLRSHYNPTGTVRKRPNLQWARLPLNVAAKAGLPEGARAKICVKCLKKLHR